MIEFTPDGPFAEKADPLFPDRVRIIGLGQTGAAVCDQIILQGQAGHDLWVFDSDQQIIDGSIVPNRHLLGRELVHGLGSSGDLELAREIAALEESRLSHVARGCDFLVLVLGLAGCTGLALAEFLIEEGRKSGARVIVVGVQPFAFEGWARREKARSAIAQLRREADSVLVLSHDRLTEETTTAKNVRHGFHLMHQLLAHTAQALAQIVCKRGLVQLSFADVRSLYGRYAGLEVVENCWVAHAEGDIHDRPVDMVDQLLASPLLGEDSVWKQVDHAILALGGSRSLGLSDVQEMVEALKDRLPANLPLVASASLDEEDHDKVRLTLLLARTAPVAAPTEEKKQPGEKPAERKAAALEPEPAAVAAPKPVKKMVRPSAPKPVAAPAPMPVESLLEETSPAPIAGGESDKAPARFIAKQEEMQFEGPPRGRFEKTHETIYNGENLDIPTFRRRRLVIQL